MVLTGSWVTRQHLQELRVAKSLGQTMNRTGGLWPRKQSPQHTEEWKLKSTGPVPRSSHGWNLRISCKGSLSPVQVLPTSKNSMFLMSLFGSHSIDVSVTWGQGKDMQYVLWIKTVPGFPNCEYNYPKGKVPEGPNSIPSVKATKMKESHLWGNEGSGHAPFKTQTFFCISSGFSPLLYLAFSDVCFESPGFYSKFFILS